MAFYIRTPHGSLYSVANPDAVCLVPGDEVVEVPDSAITTYKSAPKFKTGDVVERQDPTAQRVIVSVDGQFYWVASANNPKYGTWIEPVGYLDGVYQKVDL